MDANNRFETPATHRAARLEWFVGLLVAVALALRHLDDIRWPVFVGLFVIIDLIGYLPGAVLYRRDRNHHVPAVAYVLYNVMHNLVTGAAIVAAWALLVRPEWALLAVPIHLLGDRALFGNTMKPFDVSFEPRAHPAFVAFEQEFRRGKVTTRVEGKHAVAS
jgi:hypothetical protein